MLVMFDLPTVTADERKAYTTFRHFLLDSGFDMVQFSIYARMVSSKERVTRFEKRIANAVPERGKVQIVSITDKQYGNIKSYYGKLSNEKKKNNQLQLF